jgi:hypothetical protein
MVILNKLRRTMVILLSRLTGRVTPSYNTSVRIHRTYTERGITFFAFLNV